MIIKFLNQVGLRGYQKGSARSNLQLSSCSHYVMRGHSSFLPSCRTVVFHPIELGFLSLIGRIGGALVLRRVHVFSLSDFGKIGLKSLSGIVVKKVQTCTFLFPAVKMN